MKLSLATSLAIISMVSAFPAFPASPAGSVQAVLNGPGAMADLSSEAKAAWFPWPPWSKPEVDTEKLQDSITADALRERAEVLFNISQASVKDYGHPTRVIGSRGHWGTVSYILGELQQLAKYYTWDVQRFDAVDGRVKSYSLLIDGTEPKSVSALGLTPPTPDGKPVHGNLVLAKNFGCDVSDFPANLTHGNIVLVARGVCAFGDKSINAGKAGASAVIIYDEDAPLHGTLGEPTGKEVPSLSISTKDASKYIDALNEDPASEFEVTLYIDSYVKKIRTINVVAETKGGDHDNVVSLGAHSDSVAEGPGINDDGSGTISLLEVAKQLTKFKVNNAVRFAWWAAEEEGLLGSYAYANSLSPEENSKLRLFMDYDMMASPNYEYQIYDANNEDHPNGSGDLKDLYVDWYEAHGLNYTTIPFDGRSDYVGFIDVGIPAGGIATGAEGVKTKKGQESFGGKAGEWFDPCYHQLCDDLSNPDYEAWVINTKLIAHSVATYAKSFEGFPEREVSAAAMSSDKFSDGLKYRGSQLIM
ncbi:hypothetical protein JCM33374_g4079 [Metschnikowia sp. JCM 33374]|nr:hypothetical protein JCM33374_g4079 [Metschnikowia sp. JCM 33374]